MHLNDPGVALWTIQPTELYEALLTKDVLHAKSDYGYHVKYAHFQSAYAWMKEQMHARVSGYLGGDLWWAWTQKPDLRQERFRYPIGARQSCIEISVPQSLVLISNFHAWHAVLNGAYLALNESDDEEFDTRVLAHAAQTGQTLIWSKVCMRARLQNQSSVTAEDVLSSEIRRSWERAFDLDLIANSDYWGDRHNQAVFEILRRCDVRRVRHFIGADKDCE